MLLSVGRAAFPDGSRRVFLARHMGPHNTRRFSASCLRRAEASDSALAFSYRQSAERALSLAPVASYSGRSRGRVTSFVPMPYRVSEELISGCAWPVGGQSASLRIRLATAYV